MPRRNTRSREHLGPHHVYNRASRGRAVFRDDEDRDAFLGILASRLNRTKFASERHKRAAQLLSVAVSSYCLMTTHFHLIIWQQEDEALRRLMQSVLTTYVRAYNRKYNQHGPLFNGPYRSLPVTNDQQLRWTTAYVHANKDGDLGYRYSSHRAFLSECDRPSWLDTDGALRAFGSLDRYEVFMADRALRAELNFRFFGGGSPVGSIT